VTEARCGKWSWECRVEQRGGERSEARVWGLGFRV
jgi:hypothetical protein